VLGDSRAFENDRSFALYPAAMVRRLEWAGTTVLTAERGQGGIMTDDHTHSPEPESSSLAGYAAIKYTAIVIIVLAILAFIAWYIIPAFD
jgi:hypothetical protein